MQSIQEVYDRFKEKYEPVPECGCWIWNASYTHNGYGKFWVNRKTIRAHRYSYLIHNGRIPDGMFVMHTCDTPECVNPTHLVLGIYLDNINDRNKKGRQARGETHYKAILKEIDVLDIRANINRLTESELAEKYNVSVSAIDCVIKRKTWRHI